MLPFRAGLFIAQNIGPDNLLFKKGIDMKFRHQGLCVTDLERSLNFYEQALGFTVVMRAKTGGDFAAKMSQIENVDVEVIMLEMDGKMLELIKFKSPGHVDNQLPRPMNKVGFTHLSFVVDDIDEEVEKIRSKGYKVMDETRAHHPDLGMDVIFLLDPDGNRVEFVCEPKSK